MKKPSDALPKGLKNDFVVLKVLWSGNFLVFSVSKFAAAFFTL